MGRQDRRAGRGVRQSAADHGQRGKQLQSQRGEKIERNFAHQFDTGGMDRLYLRGRQNVHKRLLIQAAACNLALWLRSWYGAGKPKAAHDLKAAAIFVFLRLMSALFEAECVERDFRPSPSLHSTTILSVVVASVVPQNRRLDTGC